MLPYIESPIPFDCVEHILVGPTADFYRVRDMGGKTKSAKRCVMVNGVIFSGLQGVLRAIFGTLKT